MLKLCGFAGSNYYNKVKLALLEKGLPFEESLNWVGETDLDATPLGKVPYLFSDEGPLCESADHRLPIERLRLPKAHRG